MSKKKIGLYPTTRFMIPKDKPQNNIWRLWAKALGKKEGDNNHEANIVAIIRTIILLVYMITNIFIISGVIRHWNSK